MKTHRVYAGSYTHAIGSETPTGSGGIYAVEMDLENGRIRKQLPAAVTRNPSVLCFSRDRKLLYAANESLFTSRITTFAVEQDGTLRQIAQTVPISGMLCYLRLSPNGRFLLGADYFGGKVFTWTLDGQGYPAKMAAQLAHEGTGDNAQRQEGPHAHSLLTTPEGAFAFSADLGADRIYCYVCGENGTLQPNEKQPYLQMRGGLGLRHIAFHPHAPFFYVSCELSSQILVCRYDRGDGTVQALTLVSSLTTEKPERNHTSDLCLNEAGSRLYLCNCGENTVAVFAVEPESGMLNKLCAADCGGKDPRSISVIGDRILCANQGSGDVTLLALDPQTGCPNGILARIPIPGAASVVCSPIYQ